MSGPARRWVGDRSAGRAPRPSTTQTSLASPLVWVTIGTAGSSTRPRPPGRTVDRGAVDDGVHPEDDRARDDGAVPQHRRGGEVDLLLGHEPRGRGAEAGEQRVPLGLAEVVDEERAGLAVRTGLVHDHRVEAVHHLGALVGVAAPPRLQRGEAERLAEQAPGRPGRGTAAAPARPPRPSPARWPARRCRGERRGGARAPPCRCRRRARAGRRRRRRSGGAARRPAPGRRASAARPDRGGPSGRRLRPGCSRAARPGRSARSSWGGRGRT